MAQDSTYTISDNTYQWSVRGFSIIKRLLSVNIQLHHEPGDIDAGDIFLFNHFARFETFIPQYLIYQANGAYCRSVASAEFFTEDDTMAAYLRGVGAVPNDMPGLLPFLAAEILRGRKVIVFPEGGMVKDRRVQDAPGRYRVYSRTARERRKQHRGAAVLALGLDAFKKMVLDASERGDHGRLSELVEQLGLAGEDELLRAVGKRTFIAPANITFYPIRVNDNVLTKSLELFNSGMSRRATEELLIEGNILLKNTDMDIRLSPLLEVDSRWNWWDRKMMQRILPRVRTLDAVFALTAHTGGWDSRVFSRALRRKSERLRDDYMHGMYTHVTVNLSHLASAVIRLLMDRGVKRIERRVFHLSLYCAVKGLQRRADVDLHPSLLEPQCYDRLVDGDGAGLDQFLRMASETELLEVQGDDYVFRPKLLAEHEFDEIRLENLVEVYANEVAPLPAVTQCTAAGVKAAPGLSGYEFAKLRFDDQLREHALDRQDYGDARFDEINLQQTATADGNWFAFLPDEVQPLGVVLVHGFLASPAEVRGLGERLRDAGYPVIGVRLKGHATSPWDLRERSWRDWMDSVRTGWEIMSGCAERVCLVGFSTGGSLVLKLAAEQPDQLAGVAAVSVPVEFRDKNMMFVPLLHGANKLVSWVSSLEGIKPFQQNDSEHPQINYRHMPIRGLYELRVLVNEMEESLADVHCPALIVQGDRDPVVVPGSARQIFDKISSTDKKLISVPSQRHGILYEDVGGTQGYIVQFLDRIAAQVPPSIEQQPAKVTVPT